ncbi:ATP-binding cassette domain-containing protein [Clostridium botulinum]|uniref:ABC transporter ATP-binding protein n=1 Tax=unclassified Clostridium TaxID=2614128 RepID=UPI0004FF6E73|nr:MULTISPECIES: ATP-binding cassette domain-containing protein [unclassified Clostridium]AIY79136.1 ABC transporter family protein [Clostridium botulinum 202F]KAI3348720.1 ATP-binding cassette domain-containing protein [Clostridium botulinum]KFX54609.1 bacitracin ABC transporter ATP-binding protein [Clostridium botulinum]KFX60356.1 bacitracin ABC transporter ATP-binding protein [Clostridium botulinum]KON12465.1 bacitracin ABC transporter ATP-binding protein [Clostridium botulinum]
MRESILKVENLTKTYKNINALNNVNLSLERGKIYGIIGQDGSGKTTLMRLITGLCEPTFGKITLFGQSEQKKLQGLRKRIGSIIEYPGLYPNMTAKENMKLQRIMRGVPNDEVEEELLKLVGLNDIGKKKVKNFSLGMKQRLGIAMSLIGNPEFLILDEVMNGLDYVGIIEIRKLLKKLCEEKNITILISSHILSELYQFATNYIIIHNGEIKEEITLKELNEKCKKHILLCTNEPERMVYILENFLNTKKYKVMHDKSIKLYDYLDNKEQVAKVFLDNKILVTNLSYEDDALEEYFISVIGGKNV